jgi:hypothetical protein
VDAGSARGGGRDQPDHRFGDRERQDLTPHVGAVRSLAVALRVEPEGLLPPPERGERPGRLSAMASDDEEFEREVEAASIEGLSSLFERLGDEELRLRKMYGGLEETGSG